MGKITELGDDGMPPSYSQTVSSQGSTSPSKYDDLRKQIANLDSDDEDRRDSTSSQDLVPIEHDSHKPAEDSIEHDSDMPADDSQSSEAITDMNSKHKHHHYGRKLVDKLTHTTFEEREKERAERAALYQRAYEAAPKVPYGYGGYGYGGYGYGYGGYGYGLGFNPLLFGGFGGFGLGGFW